MSRAAPLHTRCLEADAAGIDAAAAVLRAGGLAAFPTETVYGLGADARSGEAVARIYDAKGRPRFNPLICHMADPAAAFAQTVPDAAARAMAGFWPGPLTLVLPRHPASPVARLAGAGLDTLAVRVPAHPVALALLRAVDAPVAAPSANRSGQVSPTRAEHVLDGLGGRIEAVLDSGACPVGVESTVLDLCGPALLLRPGGLAVEAIEAVIGPVGRPADPGAAVRSPGQLASHYAPTLPVRLDATAVAADEALLAFGPPPAGAGAVFQLSEAADPTEAASRLFEGLRALDAIGRERGLRSIAAMPVPPAGLGLAIRDRLARAAAPRTAVPRTAGQSSR